MNPKFYRVVMSSIIYFFCLIIIWITFLADLYVFIFFLLFYMLTVLLIPPRYTISPLTILYMYYGVWYVFAPLFAGRYEDLLATKDFSLAFAMVYTVFGAGVIAINAGELLVLRKKNVIKKSKSDKTPPKLMIFSLFLLSTVMIMCIINATGGFTRWIQNPGDAFLNRSGSGVFVVFSHFFSFLFASVTGFYSYRKKTLMPILFFLLWLLVTSPVHGSKAQMGLLILLVFTPWIRNLKFFDPRAVILMLSLFCLFLLGLYFRNLYISDIKQLLAYSFNYFNTLELLALSVRDFKPDFFKTFFLPFNKLLTPIGLSDPNLYFDMNHYLTDIYWPQHWAIRATEQWPVETDLYLNFYFFGGIWLFFLYLLIVSMIYTFLQKQQALGASVAAILLSVSILSHLRGSLYNHVDFYLYPMFIIIYLVLKKYNFNRSIIKL